MKIGNKLNERNKMSLPSFLFAKKVNDTNLNIHYGILASLYSYGEIQVFRIFIYLCGNRFLLLASIIQDLGSFTCSKLDSMDLFLRVTFFFVKAFRPLRVVIDL